MAQLVIVAQTLTDLEISEIKVTSTSLVKDGIEPEEPLKTIQWCARHRLIANSKSCPNCSSPMSFKPRTDINDGYTWRCTEARCRKRVSLREGSFFAKSHLPMWKIVRFFYLWTTDARIEIITHELDISKKTVIDWSNFMRDVCQSYVRDWQTPIGGRDPSGQRKIVEIDESLFFKTKYGVGRRKERQWVFGGVERGDPGNCFFVCVEDRTRETLLSAIHENILPGSIIVSDEWRAYNDIPQMPDCDFIHWTVNHSQNFVNPTNELAHTQTIENTWGRLKRTYRRLNGTSEQLFESYIFQFIFQSHYRYPSMFGNLLFWIHNYYPV